MTRAERETQRKASHAPRRDASPDDPPLTYPAEEEEEESEMPRPSVGRFAS